MTSVSPPAPAPPGGRPGAQDRIRPLGPVQRLLRRPDLGAVLGVLVSWGLFAVLGGSAFSTADGAASYHSRSRRSPPPWSTRCWSASRAAATGRPCASGCRRR